MGEARGEVVCRPARRACVDAGEMVRLWPGEAIANTTTRQLITTGISPHSCGGQKSRNQRVGHMGSLRRPRGRMGPRLPLAPGVASPPWGSSALIRIAPASASSVTGPPPPRLLSFFPLSVSCEDTGRWIRSRMVSYLDPELAYVCLEPVCTRTGTGVRTWTCPLGRHS